MFFFLGGGRYRRMRVIRALSFRRYFRAIGYLQSCQSRGACDRVSACSAPFTVLSLPFIPAQ